MTHHSARTQHGIGWLATALALVIGLVAGLGAPPADASPAPVTIHFAKSYDPAATNANGTPTWTGTLTSGATGTIEMRLVDYRADGEIEHLVLDFFINTTEGQTTARLAGTFNNTTERTVLNGTVGTGPWAGATAHEQGLRIDEDTSSFEGWVRLQPNG